MSIRSIIEINHDYLQDLESLSHQELISVIRNATDCNGHLNNANGYGVQHGAGVTTLATRHHSSRLRVIVQLNTLYDDASPQHRDIKESQ